MRITILDRYLIKEVTPNVFIGLLVFTFVMLMNQILLLAETLITRGVEFMKLFLIIYYSLPALTVLTIPMSLLLGILLALGRLGGDSELTVIKASGISVRRLFAPILAFAVVFWLFCSYLMQVTVPASNYALSRLMYRILTTNATSDLKPRIFYNNFANMVLYIQDMPTKGDVWRGVFLYDETNADKPRLILAKEGRVRPKGQNGEMELELTDGSWHEADPRRPQDYTSVYFFTNILPLPTPGMAANGEIPKGDREQTVPELKKTIQAYRAKKLPTRYLEVEIQKKYSIPFACIIFAFLASTLGAGSRKGGRSSAYAISIGIIVLYYIFLIGGERFGDAGTLPPWLAAWAGNIALGALAIGLFLHSHSTVFTRLMQHLRGGAVGSTRLAAAPVERSGRRLRLVIRIQRLPFRAFTLLDMYLVREFLKNFFLILIALVVIAEVIVATQLVDDLFKSKVPATVLLQYLKFMFPQWVFWVLPVGAMTTTLVTFGGLTKNSEVIAMKSSGISLYRISVPIIVLAMIFSVFAFWLQDYILPVTNKIANNYRHRIKGDPPETFSTFERRWLTGPDGFYNYQVYDHKTHAMYGFSVYKLDFTNFSLLKRVYAREAYYTGGHWVLKQGWQRKFLQDRIKYEPFRMEQMKLPVNPEYFQTPDELPAEMTFAELQHYIDKVKKMGFEYVRFAVDLQAKLSFPTVSLILTLIAIPFSFTTGKRGALYGIGISIFMGIVFWFFLALTKSLGYLQIFNPFVAAWTPNIIATLLALYLLFKLRT